MKTVIFDGREFATRKEELLIPQVLELNDKGIWPHMVSIIVGDDPASELYVNLKKKAVQSIGGEVTIITLNKKIAPDKLIDAINFYNNDPEIHGIMVQMPLPAEISNHKSQITNAIAPEKDIDGLREDTKFLHPTAKAVMDIIDFANGYLDLSKKLKCVVVGATGMVGRPVVAELKKKGYSVVECDDQTKDLAEKTLQADILVSATGKQGLITEDMIKTDAMIIDVGSPRGDVDLNIKSKASFVTPVPGGVGPVTIACLLENLIEACYNIT